VGNPLAHAPQRPDPVQAPAPYHHQVDLVGHGHKRAHRIALAVCLYVGEGGPDRLQIDLLSPQRHHPSKRHRKPAGQLRCCLGGLGRVGRAIDPDGDRPGEGIPCRPGRATRTEQGASCTMVVVTPPSRIASGRLVPCVPTATRVAPKRSIWRRSVTTGLPSTRALVAWGTSSWADRSASPASRSSSSTSCPAAQPADTAGARWTMQARRMRPSGREAAPPAGSPPGWPASRRHPRGCARRRRPCLVSPGAGRRQGRRPAGAGPGCGA